jgi:hypothetical protein
LTHRGSAIASSPTSRLEVRSGMASSLQAAHPSKRPEMRERRMRRSHKAVPAPWPWSGRSFAAARAAAAARRSRNGVRAACRSL